MLSCVWQFCNPRDCCPPSSAVHGISQEWTLEEVAIFFSRGSSWPTDQTHVSCIDRWIIYHQVPGKRRYRWNMSKRWGEGEGGMTWDGSIKTYMLPYIKWIASGNLLCDAGNQSWCSVITLRMGWRGRWAGGLRGRGHMYTYGWFMLMYGRSHHNIV